MGYPLPSFEKASIQTKQTTKQNSAINTMSVLCPPCGAGSLHIWNFSDREFLANPA